MRFAAPVSNATLASAESDGPGGQVFPSVSIEATDPSAFEQHQHPGQFTVYLDDPPTADLTVNYTVSGTGVAGDDYDKETLTGSVTVLAGQRSAAISVNALNDTADDGDRTVKLKLAADPNGIYEVRTPDETEATIYDDDETTYPCGGSGGGSSPPTVSIMAAQVDGAELGQTPIKFTITRGNC